jgi:hypothetical protein
MAIGPSGNRKPDVTSVSFVTAVSSMRSRVVAPPKESPEKTIQLRAGAPTVRLLPSTIGLAGVRVLRER